MGRRVEAGRGGLDRIEGGEEHVLSETVDENAELGPVCIDGCAFHEEVHCEVTLDVPLRHHIRTEGTFKS